MVKISGIIFDSAGEIRGVTFWNDAAARLFNSDAATLAGMWENCGEQEGKNTFLEEPDANSGVEFRFLCRLKLYQPPGGDRARARVDINVDHAELIAEAR